jgi:hypothetical protein
MQWRVTASSAGYRDAERYRSSIVTRLGMSLGETAIVTETDCEPISHVPRQLLIGAGSAPIGQQ